MATHDAALPVPGVASDRRFNVTSVTAFVASIVIAPLGVILSVVSLVQIKRSGERGRGLAVAAFIVGTISIVLSLALAAYGFPRA